MRADSDAIGAAVTRDRLRRRLLPSSAGWAESTRRYIRGMYMSNTEPRGMAVRTERHIHVPLAEVGASPEAAPCIDQRFLAMHDAFRHAGAAARGQDQRKTSRILRTLRTSRPSCTLLQSSGSEAIRLQFILTVPLSRTRPSADTAFNDPTCLATAASAAVRLRARLPDIHLLE